jgi:DNA-binding phage protein
MPPITIQISEEQLSKVMEASKTIQEFLDAALSPNDLYNREFLAGLKEATEEVRSGSVKSIDSFDDFAG